MAEKPILLVVDDDPRNIELVVDSLKPSFPDLEIKTASNGQAAYNLIDEQRPDFMYTDVRMPVMWGDDLLERLSKEIKLDPTKKLIPTIVMSGDDLETERGIKAVGLANKMYSPQQLEIINSYAPPKQETPTEYNRFTSLEKPFGISDLVERTRLLLRIL